MPMFQSTTKRGGKKPHQLFENAISSQEDQNNQVARPCQYDLQNNHIPDATGSKSSAEKMHLQYRDKKMLKHKFKNIVAIATR